MWLLLPLFLCLVLLHWQQFQVVVTLIPMPLGFQHPRLLMALLCLFEVHTWQMSRRGSCQPPVDHKHSNKHSQLGLAETLVHQQKNQHQQQEH
jgi:hypothetical protein